MVPKQNEMEIVARAYAYALQGCVLCLIALNSAINVETVLRQPKNPNCMPFITVSQVLLCTCNYKFQIN